MLTGRLVIVPRISTHVPNRSILRSGELSTDGPQVWTLALLSAVIIQITASLGLISLHLVAQLVRIVASPPAIPYTTSARQPQPSVERLHQQPRAVREVVQAQVRTNVPLHMGEDAAATILCAA